MMRKARMVVVWGGFWFAMSACHESEPPPLTTDVPVPRKSDAPTGEVAPKPVSPKPIRIPIDPDEPQRWLSVEKVRQGSPGAWATGSFDPTRNKLTVRTRHVQQFAIHTSRIPIDWERLVILGINGRNSELRRRNFSVYHFTRNQHGQWVVVEP